MKRLIFALLFLILFSSSAYAQGYLVTLKEEPIIPYSADSSVERVPLSSEIMFKADSIEEIQNFTDEENIINIIPNCKFELFDAPDDTYYSYQWNLTTANALPAYEKNLRGEGVRIGIIDSGFNYAHEDVDTSKIVSRYNAFTYTDDITDEIGHGTFVTGTIAADINNSLGIAGIADRAELCIYKTFNQKDTTFEKLLLALEKAIEDECDIINMSLGAAATNIDPATVNKLQSIIDTAAENNIIIVAAVGNNGTSVLNYPAACNNVIGVGSVGQSLSRSSFSNYNETVFVTAPGEKLTGLWYGSSNSYSVSKTSNRGTSFSTPVVTSMAAIARQIKSDITTDEFKELLKATSTDLGTEGYDQDFGWGLVNIGKFTDELINNYFEDIHLSSDKNSVIFTGINEDITMYTATYSDGVLIDIQKETLTHYGEIPVSYPENSDTVKLFFWQDMESVWDIINIKQKTDEI